MELYDVFRNKVLKHLQVCQAFIGELETKSYAESKSLLLSSQEKMGKIVSRQRIWESRENEEGDRRRQKVLLDQRWKKR
jgi:hypothetical protein